VLQQSDLVLQQQDLEILVPIVPLPGDDHEIDDERHDVGKHAPDHGPSLPVSCRRRARVTADAEQALCAHDGSGAEEGTAVTDGTADDRISFPHSDHAPRGATGGMKNRRACRYAFARTRRVTGGRA
jgi:hypothetical protein